MFLIFKKTRGLMFSKGFLWEVVRPYLLYFRYRVFAPVKHFFLTLLIVFPFIRRSPSLSLPLPHPLPLSLNFPIYWNKMGEEKEEIIFKRKVKTLKGNIVAVNYCLELTSQLKIEIVRYFQQSTYWVKKKYFICIFFYYF